MLGALLCIPPAVVPLDEGEPLGATDPDPALAPAALPPWLAFAPFAVLGAGRDGALCAPSSSSPASWPAQPRPDASSANASVARKPRNNIDMPP
jgi:hypothetical protein